MPKPALGKMSITQATIANQARPEGARLTPEQLAATLGVKIASVYEAMSRLRSEGLLPPSGRQTTGSATGATRAPLPLPPSADPEALLAVLERGDVLDAEQRLRLASFIATTAASPVAVQALRHLAEADPRPPRNIGPPAPQTRAEQVQRLARLHVACGLDVAREALDIAARMIEAETAVGPLAPEPDPARD